MGAGISEDPSHADQYMRRRTQGWVREVSGRDH
nr:MAG TPA: hypothetical protein [Caudoviricetes sp.]